MLTQKTTGGEVLRLRLYIVSVFFSWLTLEPSTIVPLSQYAKPFNVN